MPYSGFSHGSKADRGWFQERMRDCMGFHEMCKEEGGWSSIYGEWNVKGHRGEKKRVWIRGLQALGTRRWNAKNGI